MGIFILCGLCLIMDGFDLQAIGFVGPALRREFHIPADTMGRIQRRAGGRSLRIAAVQHAGGPNRAPAGTYRGDAVFLALSLADGARGHRRSTASIRFLAGLGLGGIMPNAMALVGEYSSSRLRVMSMMVVSNGFTLGAAFGGPIAAWLIPNYGWRGVFYFGAMTPLVIALLMIFLLPESLQFLALRGHNREQMARWLRRLDPDVEISPATEYVMPEERKKGVPIVHLFHDGRALGTLLLWVVNFMNLLNLYFLSNWLPIVVSGAGYSNTIAVNSASVLQIGGVVGTLILELFRAEVRIHARAHGIFRLACLSIAAIGQPGISLAVLFAMVFLAGFGIPGSQAGLNAFAATYYPTDLRSTGVGSGLGIGRIGSIVGPLVGGLLLARHWTAAISSSRPRFRH